MSQQIDEVEDESTDAGASNGVADPALEVRRLGRGADLLVANGYREPTVSDVGLEQLAFSAGKRPLNKALRAYGVAVGNTAK